MLDTGSLTPESNVRRVLGKTLFFPIALMAVVSGIFVYQTRTLLSTLAWVEHTEQVIGKAHGIQKLLFAKESAMRAYLLMGDAEFVEAFEARRGQADPELAGLRGLVADSPEQVARVDELKRLVAEWREAADSYVVAKREGVDLREALQARTAARRMEAITDLFADFVSREEAFLHERRLKAEEQTSRTTWIAGLLAVVLGGTLAFVTRRQVRSVSEVYDRAFRELNDVQRALRESHEQLEARVQERTAALTASNAELEAFCYSVSHDLRAPLRGIDGFSQAFLEDYGSGLDATGRRYLEFVREGIQKMGRLIDDLLDLSRLSRMDLKRKEVALSEIAERVFEDLRKEFPGRQVEFVNLREDESKVEGDPGLLAAVIQNLLANAWKFTVRAAAPRIEFGRRLDDGQAVFFVRDNGAGFDMAFRDKLFGAFQRLHSAKDYQGTGVGLATVRRIVHRHGGRVWAEGEEGKGATFYFTLA